MSSKTKREIVTAVKRAIPQVAAEVARDNPQIDRRRLKSTLADSLVKAISEKLYPRPKVDPEKLTLTWVKRSGLTRLTITVADDTGKIYFRRGFQRRKSENRSFWLIESLLNAPLGNYVTVEELRRVLGGDPALQIHTRIAMIFQGCPCLIERKGSGNASKWRLCVGKIQEGRPE